jgi:hypothetical protein
MIEGGEFVMYDAAEIMEQKITIKALEQIHYLVIEMARQSISGK